MKKTAIIFLSLLILLFTSSCGRTTSKTEDNKENSENTSSVTLTEIDESTMDLEFSKKDIDFSFDENEIKDFENNNGIIKITSAGVFKISGKYSQIIIEAPETAKPQIILDNAEISSSNGPAINIISADKVFITLAENSVNHLSDSETYDSSFDNADGVIFSKSDLTINGKGTLNIKGNYKCGIVSKDDLTLVGASLNLDTKGCAIEGKDCVKIKETNLKITSCTDGLKSTNAEENNRGFTYIESGSFDIVSTNDGIQAETALFIKNGNFKIKTGGGSEIESSNKDNNRWGMWGRPQDEQQSTETTESAKALKSGYLIRITDGNFEIDSSDDAIHSNSDAEINGGIFNISSGDDGIHSDDQLIINKGEINISKSYEGIEATVITVNDGKINLIANDDGLNAAGGNDSSALNGRPGQNPFESDSSAVIEINGGYIFLNAYGDGIDSNGSIVINDGIVLVSGPENSGNGAIDCGLTATINGGTAIITGSSGMATSFSNESKQASFMHNLDEIILGETFISFSDKNSVFASFKPIKQFNSVIISSPDLEIGKTYSLNIGGKIENTDNNGYAKNPKHSNIEKTVEIELTSVSTSNGQGNGMGFGGGKGNDGNKRPDGGMRPNENVGDFGQMPPDGKDFNNPHSTPYNEDIQNR